MKELIEIAFSPVNAFFTLLCLAFVLYWIVVIVTGLDLDLFDIHFHADTHAHFDIHAEKHLHIEGKHSDSDIDSPNSFISFLKYFNFDELPLMFMLTVVFFSVWFISINVTHFVGVENTGIGFLLLIPNFIVSLFIAKFLAKPLGYLYKQINHKGEQAIDFLGRRCRVVVSLNKTKVGQVELVVNGDPIRLNAKAISDDHISAGQEAVIVNQSQDGKYYLVEPFDSLLA
ncbi:hypothetical protein [Polluticaenibacter yanchengensis]|uniref:DUF1449 family protein n=1 Tax=Polluticaenibacter yanchengensis TaxID=3014562 RepID=A0ABT4UMU0_9BACT|nr:DUF1449 family protein [Chitinophagaceae bacterium LY-5]